MMQELEGAVPQHEQGAPFVVLTARSHDVLAQNNQLQIDIMQSTGELDYMENMKSSFDTLLRLYPTIHEVYSRLNREKQQGFLEVIIDFLKIPDQVNLEKIRSCIKADVTN